MNYNEINTPSDLKKAVSQRANFRQLCLRAEEECSTPGEEPRTNNPVVAGRGIDLSGELTGSSGAELIKEVDRVFGMTWHYFDEIVTEGLSARRFMKMISNDDHALAQQRVRAHGRLLMHLRKIDALDSITFRQKPDPCPFHGTDADILESAGLSRILDDRASIVKSLGKGILHDIEDHYIGGGHFHYLYEHPLVGPQVGTLDGSPAGRTGEQLKARIAERIFNLYASYAAADAASAAELSAPLATSSPILESIFDSTRKMDGRKSRMVTGEVAIEVGLPILHGVPAVDLLRIRQDEADSFERFRTALRATICEALKGLDDPESPGVTAADVIDEILIPALHDIDQRLDSAKKTLVKKSSVNATVGTSLAVIGLISGIPLLLPAGIALGTAIPGIHMSRYIEQKNEVEISDMYFLWKLQNSQIDRKYG